MIVAITHSLRAHRDRDEGRVENPSRTVLLLGALVAAVGVTAVIISRQDKPFAESGRDGLYLWYIDEIKNPPDLPYRWMIYRGAHLASAGTAQTVALARQAIAAEIALLKSEELS